MLFDHYVLSCLFHHVLDLMADVTGSEDEPRPVGADPVVLPERERDAVDAVRIGAFADVFVLLGPREAAELGGDAVDPFVDLAEERLVPRQSLVLDHAHGARVLDSRRLGAAILVNTQASCRGGRCTPVRLLADDRAMGGELLTERGR